MKQPLARHGLLALLALLAVALVNACGGGSDQAADTQRPPDSTQLEGAACGDCRAGYLSGVVASGGPWVDAEVRIVDSQGRQALGRTDARGRYDVPVTALAGSLLVQVTGLVGGRAQRLHSACRGAEIGNRVVNVTPLTELLVAQALADKPERLLREGRVDFFRLDATGLQQAEIAVERLVRPLLDLMGVPAQVDLRVTPFEANLRGLDGALALVQLHSAAPGYEVLPGLPGSAALNLQPGELAAAAPVSLPSAAAAAAASAGLAGLAGVQAQLAEWTHLFAQGLPDAARLRALLAADFNDSGLDATAFVDQVLRRQDAAQAGSYNLVGMRWHDARLLAVVDANTMRVRHRLSLPAPRAAQFEDMWWVQQGGRWLLAGNREVARVAVRNLAVLSAKPLTEVAVRQLPGAWCPAVFEPLQTTGISQRCHIEGGQAGGAAGAVSSVPAGGLLDLGLPGDGHFGVLGLYRSFAEQAEQRLQDHLLHSRLLAGPSQQVERHLAFELDARRSHPRATQARVSGPGLPLNGLLLVRPPNVAGAPLHPYWVWADDVGDLWSGVALGWCGQAADTAQAAACSQGWAGVQAGTSYQFDLLDAQGKLLGSVASALADTPPRADLLMTGATALFARFDIADQAELQPRWARLLAPAPPDGQPDPGQPLAVQLPWRAPADSRQQVLHVELDWWRAGFAPAQGADLLRQRATAGPDGGVLMANLPARAGFRTRWLVAKLTAQDPMGNHFVHFVAPNNPH